MEFWGVEVKHGEPLKIKPEVSMLIHISQAAVGEVKNGKGPKKVHLRLKIDDKTYVIGTLSAEDRPQILFDLVLHKEFELSHDWKDGSIYLAGYVAVDDSYGEGFSDEDEEEEDDMLVDTPQNGKIEPEKPATTNTALVKSKPSQKSPSKHVKPKNDKSTSDEDDDDSDIGDDSDDFKIDGNSSEDDFDDDDKSDDEDDTEDGIQAFLPSPKAVQKRPPGTAAESLVLAAKKAKLAVPNKSGGKTAATNGNWKKENNPKSGFQMSAKSHSKASNTGSALGSKAKRAGK